MNPQDVLDRMRRMWEARNPPFSSQGWMPVIEVDWEKHFEEFCRAHGGHPLFYAGRLLFADGWMHALDWKGPKWHPPEDEFALRRLQRSYWKLRLNAVKRELPQSKQALEQVITLLAQADGVPVEYVVRILDTDKESKTFGLARPQRRPLDKLKVDLEQRIRWLIVDLNLCKQMMVKPDEDPQEVFNRINSIMDPYATTEEVRR